MRRVLRRYRILWSTAGMIVLGIAMVAVNYLSTIYHERWDLTAGGAYSLSSDTERILSDLDRDATLHFFPLPDHVNHGSHARRNRRLITDLLREYAARTEHLSLRLLPPVRFPDRVRNLASRHGVDEQQLMQREPVLITVAGSGKHRLIPFDTLRVIRSGSGDQTASGSDASVSFARAERAITSSMVALNRSGGVSVAFLNPSSDSEATSSGDAAPPYNTLMSILSERDGFQVQEIPRPAEAIASEVDVLVVPPGTGTGAEKESMQDVLRNFLEDGSVIALSEPGSPGGFASLFREYGVELTDLKVPPPTSPNPGAPPDVERVDDYRAHSTTESLREADVPVFMRGMRVVAHTEPPIPERKTSVVLGVRRSAQSQASGQGTGDRTYRLTDGDGAAIPVAVASKSNATRAGTATPAGRLMVFGDADWVRDGLLSSLDRFGTGGNLPLFRNAVRWSAGLERELRFIPDRGGRSPFVVTEKEAAAVFTLVVVLLPGCALLLGIMIWWFRRMRA